MSHRELKAMSVNNIPEPTESAARGCAPSGLLGHNDEDLQSALTLVSVSPVKTRMWMQAAIDMAEYCQGQENCDQAAMRVLANEVYRLRQSLEVAENAINNMREKLKLNERRHVA